MFRFTCFLFLSFLAQCQTRSASNQQGSLEKVTRKQVALNLASASTQYLNAGCKPLPDKGTLDLDACLVAQKISDQSTSTTENVLKDQGTQRQFAQSFNEANSDLDPDFVTGLSFFTLLSFTLGVGISTAAVSSIHSDELKSMKEKQNAEMTRKKALDELAKTQLAKAQFALGVQEGAQQTEEWHQKEKQRKKDLKQMVRSDVEIVVGLRPGKKIPITNEDIQILKEQIEGVSKYSIEAGSNLEEIARLHGEVISDKVYRNMFDSIEIINDWFELMPNSIQMRLAENPRLLSTKDYAALRKHIENPDEGNVDEIRKKLSSSEKEWEEFLTHLSGYVNNRDPVLSIQDQKNLQAMFVLLEGEINKDLDKLGSEKLNKKLAKDLKMRRLPTELEIEKIKDAIEYFENNKGKWVLVVDSVGEFSKVTRGLLQGPHVHAVVLSYFYSGYPTEFQQKNVNKFQEFSKDDYSGLRELADYPPDEIEEERKISFPSYDEKEFQALLNDVKQIDSELVQTLNPKAGAYPKHPPRQIHPYEKLAKKMPRARPALNTDLPEIRLRGLRLNDDQKSPLENYLLMLSDLAKDLESI